MTAEHDYHARCTAHGCWVFGDDPCRLCSERFERRAVCQLADATDEELDRRDRTWDVARNFTAWEAEMTGRVPRVDPCPDPWAPPS